MKRGPAKLPMTNEEIARSYRLAADPWSQISVLADLNETTRRDIIGILRAQGINPFERRTGKTKLTLNPDEADVLFEILTLSLDVLEQKRSRFSAEMYTINHRAMNAMVKQLGRLK